MLHFTTTIDDFVRDADNVIVENLLLDATSLYQLAFTVLNSDGTPYSLSGMQDVNLVVKNGTNFNSFATALVSGNVANFNLYPAVLTYKSTSLSGTDVVVGSVIDKQFVINDAMTLLDGPNAGTFYITKVLPNTPPGSTTLRTTGSFIVASSGDFTHYEIHGNPANIDYTCLLYTSPSPRD